jgi:hypothetical protein
VTTLETHLTPTIYRLRVVLRGISPLIWRRLMVRADSTIADLHAVLQLAFAWSGDRLHRFVIHGSEYGISYAGGIVFSIDAREIRLDRFRFRFRVGERFLYEYDFSDGWAHDVRVEAILAAAPGRTYPRCVGGRRAGPPEGCGGPWAFLEQRHHYCPFRAATRTAEILGGFLDDPDRRLSEHQEDLAELAELLPWLGLEQFDRRALNHRLTEYAQRRTA